MELIGALINTAVVLGIVEIIKYYLPVIRQRYPVLLPLMTVAIGPIVASGQTWLSGQIGVPIDLTPISGVFTGAAAVMANQAGKQLGKGSSIGSTVEKCIAIFLVGILLSGCSMFRSSVKDLIEEDKLNAETTRLLGRGIGSTWKLNSGVLTPALADIKGFLSCDCETAIKALDEIAKKCVVVDGRKFPTCEELSDDEIGNAVWYWAKTWGALGEAGTKKIMEQVAPEVLSRLVTLGLL